MKKILAVILFLGCVARPFAGEILNMSIDEFAKRVLTQGDRAMTLYNTFENSTLGYKVTYRELRLPKATVESTIGKTRSDSNSIVTTDETAAGGVSLAQPLYVTGGKLAASVNENTSYSASSGTVTHSFTKPVYNVSFTQPLYVFAGNTEWRAWKKADISYAIAKDNFSRDIQSLENDARSKYFDVLLKLQQLEVEKMKSESSKRAFGVTRALADAGRLAGIEQARSEVNYQRDIRRLKNAEIVYQQAVNDALQMAAVKIDTPVKFVTKLEYAPLDLTVNELIRYALLHRPDYLAAIRQLELSKLSIREVLEANNPKLSATASYTKTDAGGDTGDLESKVWAGTLNLSWLFFDSRITHLQAEMAQKNFDNDQISLKNLERSIRTDVSNAYLDLKRTEEQLNDLKLSKEQARQSVEAVRVRYQNGRDRLIDVFDSEQELRDLELEYLNVVVTGNLSKDRLALLVGGRLQDIRK